MNRKFALVILSILIIAFLIFGFLKSLNTSSSQEMSEPRRNVEDSAEVESDLREESEKSSRPEKTLDSPNVFEQESLSMLTGLLADCNSDPLAEIYEDIQQRFPGKDPFKKEWKKSDFDISKTASMLTSSFGNNESSPESVLALANGIVSDREKKLLNQFLLHQCSIKGNSNFCTSEQIEQALQTDYSNGAFWYIKAIIEASNNDVEKTIEALEKVAASPIYDEYWGASIDLYSDALEQLDIPDKRFRVTTAIGIAAAIQTPPVHELFSFCRDQSKSRADIAHLCIDAGKKIFENGNTDITQGLGLGLQKISYSGMGLLEEVEKVDLRIKERRKMLIQSTAFSESLLYYDEELFDYWYESLTTHSEIEARSKLLQEITRKSKVPGYSPCEYNGSFQ